MTTVAEAIRAAAERLSQTSDTARLDAEVLMAHALGVSRSQLLLNNFAASAPPDFALLVERRLAHEPVAYIVGRQEFFGRSFAVSPGVLIPRADSETLIEAALAAKPGPLRVLDLGVGSGALLITVLAERPGSDGIGIERSPCALTIARENARNLVSNSTWQIVAGDWHRFGWAAALGKFDLVLCNPPYVETGADLAPDVREHEPGEALFAGADGLDDYRVLLPQLSELLNPGGVAVVEIGSSQADAVTALSERVGLSARLHHDLAGRPRALELSHRRKIPLGNIGDAH